MKLVDINIIHSIKTHKGKEMIEYKVQLESREGHLLELNVHACNDDIAIAKALDKIKFNGWEHYGYELKQLTRLK